MRAILALAVGIAFLALALDVVQLAGEPLPVALRWMIGIFAGITLLAGFAHLRLRYRRRQAYSNGRDKAGTARLYRPIDHESENPTAIVIFATKYAEWMMTLDPASVKGLEEGLAEGLPARAWLGDDDVVYGLDIGDKRTLPISAGIPFTGKLKESLAKAEKRMERMAARHQSTRSQKV